MIESEAKNKWCPVVRMVATVDRPDGSSIAISSANRTKDDQPLGRCIGSHCMAWRQTVDRKYEYTLPGSVTGGFCGLAGRPA